MIISILGILVAKMCIHSPIIFIIFVFPVFPLFNFQAFPLQRDLFPENLGDHLPLTDRNWLGGPAEQLRYATIIFCIFLSFCFFLSSHDN